MSTHESQNTFWRSKLAESSYGTRIVSGGTFLRQLITNKEPWKTGQERADDTAYANGSDIPENSWITKNMTTKSFTEDFNFTDIFFPLYDILGSVATSGSGANKTHVITPQNLNTSRTPKFRTYGEKLGGFGIHIFPSGVVQSLTISGAKSGRLSVEYSVEGNGSYEKNPSSYAQPSLSTNEFGYAQHCSLNFSDGDTIDTDYTCDLESWGWNFNNNVTVEVTPCAGEVSTGYPERGYKASRALIGQREYTVNFTYRLTDTSDPMKAAMKQNAIFSITHTITSTKAIPTSSPTAYYSLTLAHTRAQITELEYEVVDGFDCVVGTARLLSSGGSLPFTATLVNNTASYTS